jgi:hypothetical protein
MKNFLITTSLIFCCVIAGLSQQKQAVKVGPLGFLLGNYNVRYEKGISEKGAFQVGANFYDYDLIGLGTTGFGLDAGYRHYFKQSIKGGYIFPSVGYDFNSTSASSTDDTKLSFSNFGLGATVGYQWVGGGGFVVDLGLGYGYNVIVAQADGFAENRDLGAGGFPRFTFALGYAF